MVVHHWHQQKLCRQVWCNRWSTHQNPHRTPNMFPNLRQSRLDNIKTLSPSLPLSLLDTTKTLLLSLPQSMLVTSTNIGSISARICAGHNSNQVFGVSIAAGNIKFTSRKSAAIATCNNTNLASKSATLADGHIKKLRCQVLHNRCWTHRPTLLLTECATVGAGRYSNRVDYSVLIVVGHNKKHVAKSATILVVHNQKPSAKPVTIVAWHNKKLCCQCYHNHNCTLRKPCGQICYDRCWAHQKPCLQGCHISPAHNQNPDAKSSTICAGPSKKLSPNLPPSLFDTAKTLAPICHNRYRTHQKNLSPNSVHQNVLQNLAWINTNMQRNLMTSNSYTNQWSITCPKTMHCTCFCSLHWWCSSAWQKPVLNRQVRLTDTTQIHMQYHWNHTTAYSVWCTLLSLIETTKRMQQVRCLPPPSPSPCFYDSMRPAEAPGLLDFKRLTKANMLMVAGQEFLGQKGWETTQKADEPKGKSRTQ